MRSPPTLPSPKNLERAQDVSFLISDQAQTFNLSFSGYLKFLHITKVAIVSPYFRCSDEERFYPFEILAFRTLKL